MPTFKPDTVSNPTNEVIEFFGITDDYQSRLIWQLAGYFADLMWERAPRADPVSLMVEIKREWPDRLSSDIRDRLWSNMNRAISWAKAQPKDA